ncbi:uncharacterized protein LOC127795296 [Diospyros lotus]|uniref:uncharacterized protein LOC127795296 n=1 Tax=Diospyros lotus TaxID=55363 RepID=UPI0022564C20|nr:uncharacterized protein LOC127795296 [Diospyros lotus]
MRDRVYLYDLPIRSDSRHKDANFSFWSGLKFQLAGRSEGRTRKKMSSSEILVHREHAEIHQGEAICKKKSKELLEKMSLPKGLLPLEGLVEVGYNDATGFIWLTKKSKTEHTFRKIGRRVSYDTHVTAFVEERRMRRLTGVKSKELFIWVSISDIHIGDPASGKITFATATGMSRSFPVSAFEDDEEENGK